MKNLVDYYHFTTNPGPWFESADTLPAAAPERLPVRLIAYYLPQFHSIEVNNREWGTGFTEWTNVTKALPRFRGHLQPRLPADLGFYDLSHPEVLYRQAELLRRAGLTGLCIHDYWFSGTKVLDRPLRNLLDHPEIDLPFCLNWANENWTRRWDGADSEVILQQSHAPGDAASYIDSVAEALEDSRYIRVDGKPLLMIYRPEILVEPRRFVEAMRERALILGLGELFLSMAHFSFRGSPSEIGIDAVSGFPPHARQRQPSRDLTLLLDRDRGFAGRYMPYGDLSAQMLANYTTEYPYFPGVCPGWDNEARRVRSGTVFPGATPAKYGAWLEAAARMVVAGNVPEERIVFLNAWNEWAEGAVLEPCRHFGHAYLAETRRVIDRLAERPEEVPVPSLPQDDRTPLRYRFDLMSRRSPRSILYRSMRRLRLK